MEKAKFNLRLDETLLKEMKMQAIKEGKTLNSILIDGYYAYLRERNIQHMIDSGVDIDEILNNQ